MRSFHRSLLFAIVACSFVTCTAFASTDRVSIGNDITLRSGESAGDVVCVFCNVVIQGHVRGGIVSVFGGIRIQDSQQIAGDMVAVGGDISLDGSSTVQGDLVVVGGDLTLAPDAMIHGDREVFPGRAWLLLPFVPFLFVIGVVWLAIWLIRRNTYRFPMYPHGRGL
jgi:predicted acyltransferase (DUF342 family)